MYDWANSVYQLTIASAIFPVYYNTITNFSADYSVNFFGLKIINTVLYSWAIAAAYLLIALLSPMLSSIADYTGRRKFFMQIFTWIGALSCCILFFFDEAHIELGIIAFTLGTIGYCGSLVYYNSFLPVIAETSEQDKISARGYSMGYLGGVILLVINLIIILFPGFFGITDLLLPPRIAFLSVFIWWIGFSQITFSRLPKYTYGHNENRKNVVLSGYKELRSVFKQLRKSPVLSLYLAAFFFNTMGILSVMFMAATYGEKQLKLGTEILISTILVIQLVGMFGAWLFARISGKIGNIKGLIIAISGWILICIGAYLITDAVEFIIVAFFVGIVMGGSQSLGRSTYSKMLPETTGHTSFFSFYDVMEKLATVGGTFCFGIIEALTGSMRNSILALIVFFVFGIFFLLLVIRKEKMLTPHFLK